MAFRLEGELHTIAVTTNNEVLKMIRKMEFVVFEQFATSGRLSSPGLATIMLCGEIVGWCKANKIPYEAAIPQNRYTFMKEAQGAVGPDGLIMPSNVAKHEVDALAHLLAWEYRHRDD